MNPLLDAYTTDTDPFRADAPIPRRRRSSLLNKWIQEQQRQPHDTATLTGYDLVDDDDIPPTPPSHRDGPSTPSNPRLSRRASKLLLAPSPFRNFNLPFRSASPATTVPSDGSSPRPSRFSFIPRSPRSSTDPCAANTQHARSSSLSTLTANHPRSSDLHHPASPPRWRPSVLGHFSTSQTSVVPSDTACTQSRPSMSSAETYTSGTSPTTVESDLLQTPSNVTLMDPIRSTTSVFKTKSGFASSSSIWSHKHISAPSHSSPALSGARPFSSTSVSVLSHRSLSSRLSHAPPKPAQPPTQATHDEECDLEDTDEEDSCDFDGQTLRQRGPDRPQIAYSASSALPRVKFASLTSRHRKKKKLVVSGVGFNDSKKFEGVKRWCESFGEVSQIVRMPNGDLHVHFRLAEVADTVCRLRAKVYIAGVGSVQLSWFTGDKR